jgi:hypothetical protein
MSEKSLLNEARSLIERSRTELQNIQQDKKRQKMNNTDTTTTTAAETIAVDPMSALRDEKNLISDSTPAVTDAATAGRLYTSGLSIDAVGKNLGVSYAKARRLVREAGVELRDPSARLKGRTRKSAS